MNKHVVFVYGSLKQGFGNHAWHLSDPHHATFLGRACTKDAQFEMRSLGGFPAVVKRKTGRHCYSIIGELYSVDDIVLAKLDRLESNGKLYQREMIPIVDLGGKVTSAWMYLFCYSIDGYERQNVQMINLTRTEIAQSWEKDLPSEKKNESSFKHTFEEDDDLLDDAYCVKDGDELLYATHTGTVSILDTEDDDDDDDEDDDDDTKPIVTWAHSALEVDLYPMSMDLKRKATK